jgi:hypothetical protein
LNVLLTRQSVPKMILVLYFLLCERVDVFLVRVRK